MNEGTGVRGLIGSAPFMSARGTLLKIIPAYLGPGRRCDLASSVRHEGRQPVPLGAITSRRVTISTPSP
jgi:hypothetical protein